MDNGERGEFIVEIEMPKDALRPKPDATTKRVETVAQRAGTRYAYLRFG
jgi:hypothetical protein